MLPIMKTHPCTENVEHRGATVWTVSDIRPEEIASCCAALKEMGYEEFECRARKDSRYIAFRKGEDGVFLNYYEPLSLLTVVREEKSEYFDFSCEAGASVVSAQITQIDLEDFGMSYVIRLPDGRFLVIDGGRPFEPDAEKLFNCLKKGTSVGCPVIAAWIMSHPHSDHFQCFIPFMDRYGEEVEIQRYLFNFPEADDLAHYPKLNVGDPRFGDNSSTTTLPMMLARMEASGGKIFTPHTGQVYQIGDARCEILSSMDDTVHVSDNINATSLVIRMELAGQVILFTTDCPFSIARLPERYGEYLKADILQVPHHGFQSGTAEAEIRGYKLIRPGVCLLPVSDFNAFTVFCNYRRGTRFLYRDLGIDELITGSENRTITLPYSAPAYKRAELERRCMTGLDDAGATSWIFSELSTARESDFVFTVLNTTHVDAVVWIELFFEDPKRKVRMIKTVVGSCRIRRLNIVDEADVDGDALWFKWLTLKEQGVPENVPFAVRFRCDIPIVVSHAEHRETYRSPMNR